MGTGGSAGREGPIAQIGGGLGSVVAGMLRLSSRQRRILMIAGVGAGIGAIFRAPLAGALFSAEVLYRDIDLEHEALAPAILSSIVATSTFGFIFGWQPLFGTPAFRFDNLLQLLLYAALAVVVTIGAEVYVWVFYGVRDLSRRVKMPRWLRPAAGGLVVGAVGLLVPQALSTGFGVLQDAFDGKAAATFLFVVAGAKILTTAFTVGTGGSGGVFGPAVVIGGALGGGVGLVFHQLFPGLVAEPGAFAMVGMAGFFAAAAHVPISTVIMVSELTGNYHLLVPAMLVCMLGFLMMRRQSLYEKQVPTRADSPAHQSEMMRDALQRLRVEDALSLRPPVPPEPVGQGVPLAEVLERLSSSRHTCLPVVDAKGDAVGVLTLDAVQRTLGQPSLAPALVAMDLAAPPVSVTRRESVYDATVEMATHGRNEVLVVDDADPKRIVDVLTATDIAVLYDKMTGGRLSREQAPRAGGGMAGRLAALFRRE